MLMSRASLSIKVFFGVGDKNESVVERWFSSRRKEASLFIEYRETQVILLEFVYKLEAWSKCGFPSPSSRYWG